MNESLSGAVVAGVSAFATGLAIYTYFNSKSYFENEKEEEASLEIQQPRPDTPAAETSAERDTNLEYSAPAVATPSKVDQETDTSELSQLAPVQVAQVQDLFPAHNVRLPDPVAAALKKSDDSQLCNASWSEEVEQFHRDKTSSVSSNEEIQTPPVEEELRKVQWKKTRPRTGLGESPANSEDSGTVADRAVCSSMSPLGEEEIGIPPMYEFEIPQDLVGLLIGQKGQTIKHLMERSGAHVVIRQHFSSDNMKICTIEGSREQINLCLRQIRRRFPPYRFPELRLDPLLPPPITSPHTPVYDSVVQLALPEGVRFEALLSSLVSVGHMFLQQPTHPTFQSLSRLDTYMMAVYSQPFGIPEIPGPIEAGIICAAPVMGGWYRAQCMAYFEAEEEALVKFVDYGGFSRLPASELRQIRSDFMSLPFQAAECLLARTLPLDPADPRVEEATQVFETFAQNHLLVCEVVGYSPENNTPLVDVYVHPSEFSEERVLLSKLLAESNCIDYVEDDELSSDTLALVA